MESRRLNLVRTISLGGVAVGLCAAMPCSALAEEPQAVPARAAQTTRQAGTPSPPSPPIPALSVPAIVELPSQRARDADSAPVTLDLVVTKGRERLLSESLTVGARSGGSINRSKEQYGGPCPGDDDSSRSMRSVNESLRLSIYPANYRFGDTDMFRLSIMLQIPRPDCGSFGSNSLGIDRIVSLGAGQQQVLEGPDGLSLRISRRK